MGSLASGAIWLIGTGAALIGALIFFTIYFAFRDKQMDMSGRNAIEGETGVASTDINPKGHVLVHGEWWNARADEHIPEGAKVKVIKAEEMMLTVVRVKDE